MSNPIVWGVEASPFLLKLEAMLRFCEIRFRRLPAEGSLLENARVFLRLQRAIRARQVVRHPQMDPTLDEYPGAPFFSEDGRSFQYDSTALGHWLDERSAGSRSPLFPAEPRVRFVAELIDEAFDEYGLYMVHHMRWVASATDTAMGERAAAEVAHLVTPLLAPLVRIHLPRRQVRRCPYLFSVAPAGHRLAAPPQRVPPSRPGFPPTHELLHESWCTVLAAMESLLETQPFILGDRFSIADASVYGQLSMNLVDASAERELSERAPRTRRWLGEILEGGHVGGEGELHLSDALEPLLGVLLETFVPLMAQNESAWLAAVERGETRFNEAAFDQNRALYEGELLGTPFRSVVKTFQVRVWRDLRRNWQALEESDRQGLHPLLPGFERWIRGRAADRVDAQVDPDGLEIRPDNSL